MDSSYISSAHAVREFAQSSIWQDLTLTIGDWLEDTRDKLEAENDALEIRRYQGIAECLRNVLNLPESTIAMIEMQEEDSNGV